MLHQESGGIGTQPQGCQCLCLLAFGHEASLVYFLLPTCPCSGLWHPGPPWRALHSMTPAHLLFLISSFYSIPLASPSLSQTGSQSMYDTGINITWNLLEIPVHGLQPKPAKTEALGWACILSSLQVF